MDLASALSSLPHVYERGLRLHLAGVDDASIAAELGLEPEALPSFLRLAHEKLAALLDVPEGARDRLALPSRNT